MEISVSKNIRDNQLGVCPIFSSQRCSEPKDQVSSLLPKSEITIQGSLESDNWRVQSASAVATVVLELRGFTTLSHGGGRGRCF